jgi:hypothetical protein
MLFHLLFSIVAYNEIWEFSKIESPMASVVDAAKTTSALQTNNAWFAVRRHEKSKKRSGRLAGQMGCVYCVAQDRPEMG